MRLRPFSARSDQAMLVTPSATLYGQATPAVDLPQKTSR
jgi:hypothetical protein